MKDVVGYEGLYSVSSDGRIWSEYTKKYLSPGCTRGYLVVSPSKDGISKSFKVHRLVAEAYIPNPENKPFVNHKDGDKLNNHVDNLEWCTAQENTQHAHDMGLAKAASGADSPCAKLSAEDVLFIRANYRPRDKEFGMKGLGIKFNIAQSTISNIINNKSYKNVK